MAPLSGEWLEALKGEFHQPYYSKLYKTVMQEYQTQKIFPPAEDMFNAFHFTPLSQVKVVILGQDPYHNDGQAHGLCFSVKRDVEIPPSLVNIYQELHDDLGCYIPDNGYLEKWAKQGVLMLNTVLTVRAHQANSHRGIGWEQFTDAAIRILNEQDCFPAVSHLFCQSLCCFCSCSYIVRRYIRSHSLIIRPGIKSDNRDLAVCCEIKLYLASLQIYN